MRRRAFGNSVKPVRTSVAALGIGQNEIIRKLQNTVPQGTGARVPLRTHWRRLLPRVDVPISENDFSGQRRRSKETGLPRGVSISAVDWLHIDAS